MRVSWKGQKDREWLTRAGKLEWLVFSYNKKQLLVLTSGEEKPAKVLGLLLKKWADLELLDKREQRPFARFLSPSGYLRDRYKHYSL